MNKVLQREYINNSSRLAIKKDEEIIKNSYKEINMKSGNKILPFYATPYFLTKTQYKEICKVTNLLSIILNKVAKEIFSNKKKYLKLFNLGKIEKKLYTEDVGFLDINIFSRFDMFYDGKEIKLIEYNTESPSGMGRSVFIEEIFTNTELFKKFSKTHNIKKNIDMRKILLKTIIKKYKEFTKSTQRKTNKKPTIALIDWRGISTISDQKYIMDYFKSKGHVTFLCSPSELYYKNKKLYYKDKVVNIIYKRSLTTEIINKQAECRDFLDAVTNKKVCMVNPFASNLLGEKKLLNYIEKGIFNHVLTLKEQAIIKKTIPWSRTILKDKIEDFKGDIVDSKEFLIKNKTKLVLKSSIGYGGKDVFIGNQTSTKEWNKIVKLITKTDKWIVQEYIKIPKIELANSKSKNLSMNKYINICPYVINNKVAGFLARVSSSKIINTSMGGGIIPTFIVDSV